MSDEPQSEPEQIPEPPEPDPDLDLIGYFERGYPGPRETKTSKEDT